MKKRLLILISFFILFSFGNISSYGYNTNENPQPITVKLNGQPLKFDAEPIIEKDRTMVPMRTIFENLGAEVDWIEDIQTVIGYKRYKGLSEMFIKLKIGDDTMYRNGKSFPLDSPPIIRNDRTLVPVRFIAESFGIKVDWDAESRAVLLSYDTEELQGTKLIDDISYKPRFFENGLKVMIPEYWQESDNSNKFGYKDEENNIQMAVEVMGLETPKTLDEFTEESKSSIFDEYKDKIVFTGSDKININNIDVNVVYLKNSSITPEINQVIYHFTSLDYGYKIRFSYYSESNDSQLLNIISNIVNTIEISGVTFNFDNEHYIEYGPFFDYGMNLSSEIYSSMQVENEFNFKGTIKEDANLEYLVVSISKENEKSEFKIPVLNNEFDSQIYTPFGLGKHNITIATPKSQENPSQKIMQFSIINASNQNTRYLIPSLLVEKDDRDIVELAAEITQNAEEFLNQNDKAKDIFKWIYENIEYDIQGTNDTPRSAKGVLTDKKGTQEEIAYLYAGLLRASEIPCKLVKGTINEDEGTYHVWNEIEINGKWIIVDVNWGSGYVDIDSDNITKELDMNYFNPSRDEYEKKFTEIVNLKY